MTKNKTIFKQKQRVQNDRETLRKIDGEIQESDKKFFQLEDENKELTRGNLKTKSELK